MTQNGTDEHYLSPEDVSVSSLESRPLGLEGGACLEFWYRAPLAANGSELRAALKDSAGQVEIWTSPALDDDYWRQVFVSLNVTETGTRQPIILSWSTPTPSLGEQCEPNTEFWTDESTRCLCSGGRLSCSSSQCPEGHKCGPQQDSSGIITSGTCTVHSDCSTFDGVLFRFMAPCTYVLAQTCSPNKVLPRFSVEVVNKQSGNSSVSAVQQVTVELSDLRVSLLKRQTHRAMINGIWRKLPLSLNNETVKVRSNPAAVVVENKFGIVVSYDNAGAVHVTVPAPYSGEVCGMCGNFNNRRDDDDYYGRPDGPDAPDATASAPTWETEGTPPCDTILVPHKCDPRDEAEYAGEPYCGSLLSGTGPFSGCSSVVGVESYFRSCVAGMCAAHGDMAVLCETLEAYAAICREAGVGVSAWRNSTLCPLECGENSHYNSCAEGCPEVCSRLDVAGACGTCEERCECDPGFKLSGERCVLAEDCGCWNNGAHYEKEAMFLDGECEEQCQCVGNNAIQCSTWRCGDNEVCGVKDGVKGCFPSKPATCRVYGDPHYITFDGRAYDFQGGCNYTLATTAGEHSPVQFTVTGRNLNPVRQNPTRSKLEAVALQVEELHVILNQNGNVYVHNRLIHLPYNAKGTYGSLKIYAKKQYVILETTFGLRMMIDRQNRLFLQVDERHKGELRGLCGTYSDDQGDDFIKPDGRNATEPFDFGNSWRVTEDDTSCVSHPDDPRPCNAHEENLAYYECSKILGEAFGSCHDPVHPLTYLASCVYDYCATRGDLHTLCDSLESYVAACQVVGVDLPHWQNNTACVCPLNCNFDNNMCGWEQLIQDSFDWTRQSGPTPSNPTGPNQDHTTGNGFYMYIEGDGMSHGDSSRLLSSKCHYSGPLCLHFWYHMYGSASAMALNIYGLQGTKVTKLWSKVSNQGPEWHPAYVDMDGSESFQIIVEGIRGSDVLSDVAIDDFFVHSGSCSAVSSELMNGTSRPPTSEEVIPSHPVCNLDCGFDSNLCSWSQMMADAFDWTWESGSTPTLMTGPSTDHTSGGDGHYLYIEASSVTQGDTARLLSSECSHSGPQCLQFWYHMYGTADTMGLHVYLLQDNIVNDVWWKRNDQGNIWHLAQVDLTTTGPFQVIFEGRRGASDQSDVAIDDVSLHRGRCAADKPCSPSYRSGYDRRTCASSRKRLHRCTAANLNHSNTTATPTCGQLHGPPSCREDASCVQGCVCDDGFVLKGKVCVPIQQCGCVDQNGNKHHFDETWYTNHCSQKCECEEDDGVGEIDCEDEDECDGDSVCLQNEEGQYYCESTDFSDCTIERDPEYRTFDDMKHEFEGRHSYVLVKTTGLPNDDDDDSSSEEHDSHGDSRHRYDDGEGEGDDGEARENRRRGGHHGLRELKIRVYNRTLLFTKNRRLVVDGRITRTPVSPAGGLKIWKRSSRIYLKTDFGLSVKFYGHGRAEITLPHTYKSKVGGLCGNFDGKKKNDLMKPDGSQAATVTEFGNSWRVTARGFRLRLLQSVPLPGRTKRQ
ncbi:zonadhesin [Polymixia lowei]